MKTVVITAMNPTSGYKGACIQRRGRTRYHYSISQASWQRLAQVCRPGKREPLSIMHNTITTKIVL